MYILSIFNIFLILILYNVKYYDKKEVIVMSFIKRALLTASIIIIVFSTGKVSVWGKDVSTDYGVTLDEAVQIQIDSSARPTTSLYKADQAYLHQDNIKLIEPDRYIRSFTPLYDEPNQDSEKVRKPFPIKEYTIQELILDESNEDGLVWLEVLIDGEVKYLPSYTIPFLQVELVNDSKVYDFADSNGHLFGQAEAGRSFFLLGKEGDHVSIHYDPWRYAKKEDVAEHLSSEQKWQHVRLDKLAHVSVDEINDVLINKGSLEDQGEAFQKGAEDASINEAYLIAHAFLETGHGRSPLANGIEVGVDENDQLVLVTEENEGQLKDVKTVYNMFGIEAVDSCPIECGAIKAYEEGWTSPAIAIEEGAHWIGGEYIYNDYEQNTLFKMRWNPYMKDGAVWKQYATDIGWPIKQSHMIEDILKAWDHPDLTFDYPSFK